MGNQFNPTSSSVTNSQAREFAVESGTCSDGTKCGQHPIEHFGDDGFCAQCPNMPEDESEWALLDKRLNGHKYDADKPRLDLLIADMPRALEEVAAVLTYGASKYSPGNWQHVDNAERRYLAAGMRHELEYAKGEAHDDETNLHHLAHAACCLLFRLELAMRDE